MVFLRDSQIWVFLRDSQIWFFWGIHRFGFFFWRIHRFGFFLGIHRFGFIEGFTDLVFFRDSQIRVFFLGIHRFVFFWGIHRFGFFEGFTDLGFFFKGFTDLVFFEGFTDLFFFWGIHRFGFLRDSQIWFYWGIHRFVFFEGFTDLFSSPNILVNVASEDNDREKQSLQMTTPNTKLFDLCLIINDFVYLWQIELGWEMCLYSSWMTKAFMINISPNMLNF